MASLIKRAIAVWSRHHNRHLMAEIQRHRRYLNLDE